jgi:hypothetical protein
MQLSLSQAKADPSIEKVTLNSDTKLGQYASSAILLICLEVTSDTLEPVSQASLRRLRLLRQPQISYLCSISCYDDIDS